MFKALFKIYVGFTSGIIFTANFSALYGAPEGYPAAEWKMWAAIVVPVMFCLCYLESD